MRCVLNGVDRELADGSTVADAVAVLAPTSSQGIAVALQGDVVPRSAWPATTIPDGAQLEVLVAVQGG